MKRVGNGSLLLLNTQDMKTIKIDIPINRDIEIHLFADEHIGDKLSDITRLKKRIEEVANKPNAFAILNGDLMNNALLNSPSDTYAEVYSPMEQVRLAAELFQPIKDKILCVTSGNHEWRTKKDTDIDITYFMCAELGISDKYTSESALVFVRFGHSDRNRPIAYSIYVNHGSGGGRADGGKINKLLAMASIIDADVYIHSHTHLPAIVKKDFFRTSWMNSSVDQITRLFVNTASNLSYGGYGERGEFTPSSKDTPTIYLANRKKKAEARL